MAQYDKVVKYDDGARTRWLCMPCKNCNTLIEDFIDSESKELDTPFSELNWLCSGCHSLLWKNKSRALLHHIVSSEELPQDLRTKAQEILDF